MAGPAVRAGLAYFALVFLAGFALGVLRTAVLVPLTGDLVAVMIELPVILWVSWKVCAALLRRFDVPPAPQARLSMGSIAFVCLMAAEVTLSAAAFGRSPADYLTGLMEPAGALGFAGQVLFALFPWLQAHPAGRQ